MPLSRITDSSISNNSITIEDFASARDSAIYSPGANVVAIRTADTERMRVNSTGNTFIGVTGATWDERLGVRPITGTGQVGIGVYSSNTSYASSCIRVQSENGTGANWYLYEGRGQGGAVNYWVNGNGLIYTGQGIQFPATQVASANPNTLDDYEEGTWTPRIENASGSEVVTLTNAGKYTKIGRLVHVQINAYAISSSALTATNHLYLANLPFTTDNSIYCLVFNTYANQPVWVLDGGAAVKFPLYVPAGAQDYTPWTRNVWGGATSMTYRGEFTYEAT
jgi:hypothetical protein